jgi:hypothetical protein
VLLIYTYNKTGFQDCKYLYKTNDLSDDVLVYESYHNGMCDSAYYNGFSHERYNGYTKKFVPYTSTKAVLEISDNYLNSDIAKPTDIKSITEDYVFNYNANPEESSAVLYSMINSGWQIDSLESNSQMIKARLLRNGIQARMYILPQTLKLYCKTDLNKEATE